MEFFETTQWETNMINPFRVHFTEGQKFDYLNVMLIVVNIDDGSEYPEEFGGVLIPRSTMVCDYVNVHGEILTKEFQECHIPALTK